MSMGNFQKTISSVRQWNTLVPRTAAGDIDSAAAAAETRAGRTGTLYVLEKIEYKSEINIASATRRGEQENRTFQTKSPGSGTRRRRARDGAQKFRSAAGPFGRI